MKDYIKIFEAADAKRAKQEKENITQVPVLNLLKEYTALIYIFANNDDSKINFLNSNFNGIIKKFTNFFTWIFL